MPSVTALSAQIGLSLPATRRKRVLLAVRAIALAALVAFALGTPGFLSTVSLVSLMTTMSFIGCVAIGMTFITLSGNIMSFALGATLGGHHHRVHVEPAARARRARCSSPSHSAPP